MCTYSAVAQDANGRTVKNGVPIVLNNEMSSVNGQVMDNINWPPLPTPVRVYELIFMFIHDFSAATTKSNFVSSTRSRIRRA